MIYTFSPNWYKPQCLHFTNDSLYYCSNYVLYEFDLAHKKVIRELCFRQIAMQYNLNHRDIKINSIQSNQKTLYIGINQPHLVIINKITFQIEKIVDLQKFESVQYIYLFGEQKKEILLCNKEGSIILYRSTVNELQKIQTKHKLSGVKAIYCIDNHHCAIFTRGNILIYNNDFTKLQKSLDLYHNETIYSVDTFQQNNKTYFAFLSRNKEQNMITLFQFSYKEQFPLELKKKIDEISINLKKFNVNVYYPKKFTEKLKMAQKASITIKLISQNEVLMTGKFGEVFSLYPSYIQNESSLLIKPYSYEEESKSFRVWIDSKHYKEIYAIYKHLNHYYMISTDHNLSVWSLINDQVKYAFSIKFLTSSVQNFFYSQSDPRNIFALLKDSIVRSFSPLDEGSHYLNQYWRFTKKFKIKKAVCHPDDAGILGLVTECNKIQIYDAFQDRLMRLIEVEEEIINISFQYESIIKQLELLFDSQFAEQKFKSICHFVKQMDNKTIMLVQTKLSFYVLANLAHKDITLSKMKKDRRLERIHNNRYWDEKLILSSQSKQLSLCMKIRYEDVQIEGQLQLKYQQGRFMFKNPSASSKLYICNFKGTKMAVFQLQILKEDKAIEKIACVEILLPYSIDFIHISYEDWRVALYNQRDDIIQLVHLDKLSEDKLEAENKSEVQIYSLNTKIESLMFYLEEYMIIATKDQTIKVIKYSQYLENALKKKKAKPKKALKGKMSEQVNDV